MAGQATPCWCPGKVAEVAQVLGRCTHKEAAQEAPSSWLLVFILGVDKQMEDLSPCVTLITLTFK